MKCFKSIIAAMAITVSAAAAMADTTAYNTAISVDGSSSLAPQLQQFNPSLGTLTGVSVSLNVSITPIASVYNIGSTPAGFTEAWTGTNPAAAPLPFSGSDNPFTVTDPYNNSNTVYTDYSWNAGSGTANPGANDFADPNPIALNALVSSVPGANFGDYVGTGNYALNYTTTQTASAQGTPGYPLFYGSDWTLNGTATVTYTYTPSVNAATTPLPASAAGGMVLMGLLAVRKLRTA